jgi:hypothetical protein
MTWLEGPGLMTTPPMTPGPDKTGPIPPRATRTEMSIQEMEKIQREEQAEGGSGGGGGSGYGPAGSGNGQTAPPATISFPLQAPAVTTPITINPNQPQGPPQ